MSNNRSLELTCYSVGFGAFGVFIRWLQLQIAFDENGLVDKSVFNFLVPALIIGTALLFQSLIEKERHARRYLPKDFCVALYNPGKIFEILRWAFGIMMIIGALFIIATCEVDPNADFLRVLAIIGIAAGVSYPLLLTSANKPHVTKPGFVSFLSFIPILFFAVFLILSYKENATNSIVWEYLVEVVTIIVTMIAFFRMAGFAFLQPDPWKAMFWCMWATTLCIMSIADSRNLSLQIIFLASAGMLSLYNWIMLDNLQQRPPKETVEPEDGFEHL